VSRSGCIDMVNWVLSPGVLDHRCDIGTGLETGRVEACRKQSSTCTCTPCSKGTSVDVSYHTSRLKSESCIDSSRNSTPVNAK
jgi:hypothetical protein